MNRKIKRVAIGGVLLLLTAMAGLFVCRNFLLQNIINDRMIALTRRHDLQLSCRRVQLNDLTSFCLHQLVVVPAGRDTLLKLDKLEVEWEFLPLLKGDISVVRIGADGLALRFVKQKGRSNYDFLFRSRPSSDGANEQPAAGERNYAQRVEKLLQLLFRLLPENAAIRQMTVVGQRDSSITRFRIDDFQLRDSHFDGDVAVEEGALQDRWRVRGALDRHHHSLQVGIAAADAGRKVRLPYIRSHYQTVLAFDSVNVSLGDKALPSSGRTLQGAASVAGLTLHHQALSPDTIELNRAKIAYVVKVGKNSWELDSTSCVTFNQLTFHPYLRAERTDDWHFVASIHQPSFPATCLFSSLPAGLFRHLQGLKVQGDLRYDLRLDVDFNALDSLQFSSDLVGHGVRITDFGQTELTKMNGEFDYTAYDNDVPVRTFAVGPSNPNFRRLDQLSPLLRMAVLQSEDGGFFYHQGFLPGAIQEALAYDLKVGRFARGGSTISMQLVKNVFLNRHKNIARKLEEALLVWLIEQQHLTSKERMYEVYLNIAEWGPGVYGACEAARFYFSKEPSDLTLNEAIFMASVIPHPKHLRWSFHPDGTLKETLEGHFRLVAGRMAAKGVITEEQAEAVRPQVELKGAARNLLLATDSLSLPGIPTPESR